MAKTWPRTNAIFRITLDPNQWFLAHFGQLFTQVELTAHQIVEMPGIEPGSKQAANISTSDHFLLYLRHTPIVLEYLYNDVFLEFAFF